MQEVAQAVERIDSVEQKLLAILERIQSVESGGAMAATPPVRSTTPPRRRAPPTLPPQPVKDEVALAETGHSLWEQDPVVEKEEFTMKILFISDPSGVRHACEVTSTEWNIDTIYEKALAATGIPITDQVLYFGGRVLMPRKTLTSYGVQHGSEIVLKTKSGQVVQSRQRMATVNPREIKAVRGKQSI
jgi:hypothetical protein